MEIGESTALNSGIMVNADVGGKIRIGKYVLIGPNVVFRASNHIFENKNMPIRKQGHNSGYILIGDDVWVGENAVILPNVKVGTGAVIAAGSVVTKNITPFTIAGGVPAKQIGVRG